MIDLPVCLFGLKQLNGGIRQRLLLIAIGHCNLMILIIQTQEGKAWGQDWQHGRLTEIQLHTDPAHQNAELSNISESGRVCPQNCVLPRRSDFICCSLACFRHFVETSVQSRNHCQYDFFSLAEKKAMSGLSALRTPNIYNMLPLCEIGIAKIRALNQ